jgi:2,3-bisphosphoglycerate-independent phosphoglycerate mutase
MKYIVLVADGMADYPLEELGNKTPLQASRIPNMNFLAQNGQLGMVKTIPEKMSAASDIANLSIFGYDPKKYYTGRGPLEAANMGVRLEADEVAFRCNLVTASSGTLVDYSAGHISNDEAKALIEYINEKLGSDQVRFYPGVSYRHLMVLRDASHHSLKAVCVPPHNIMGEKIKENLPRGKGAEILAKLMQESQKLLSEHEINKVRIDLKENPANMIWLWGQGVNPTMPSFQEKYALQGSVISAVDLLKGLGRIIGLDVLDVPGATGYYDTNYEGKADYALKSLERKDFVFVHVEATDEAGHNGDVREKILAIERFDYYIVGAFLKHFKERDDFRIMVLPDHPTPIALRTHTAEPVPFAIYGRNVAADKISEFSEAAAKSSSLKFERGFELMDYFIKGINHA